MDKEKAGRQLEFLVLGGNGYLGSKVVHALVRNGHVVVCTRREHSDLKRLEESAGRIELIQSSAAAVDEAMRQRNFMCVVNAACNYGRGSCTLADVVEANLGFPLEVLGKSVENGIKRFLTIGTSLPESLNLYSFTKKIFADFGRFYSHKNKITFYNMQPEMFYGSDEPEDRFIPELIGRMLDGKDINVTVGTQRRDLIAVGDVVDAVVKVVDSEFFSVSKGYREIPVGTGIAPTISELVDYIWDQTGRKSKVNKGAVSMRDDEPDCIADCRVMAGIAEWNPVFWKDGIGRMVREMAARRIT